jgi:Skp family chaperone for outer membrane proteins
MKKIFLSLFAFAALCGGAQAQKQPRVATVDMAKVLAQYTKAADQRDILTADAQEVQKRQQGEEQSLRALLGEVQRAQVQTEDQLLNESGRANARNVLEAKKREFESRRAQYQQALKNIEDNLRARAQAMEEIVLADIRPVVGEVAKAKSADLVLSSSFTPNGVLFADASLDVTDEVVKRLNADYTPRVKPAGAATAAPAATPAPAPVPAPGIPGSPAAVIPGSPAAGLQPSLINVPSTAPVATPAAR